MAIFKLGTIVTGIRGTLGGITFSANGSGTYCKSWMQGPKRRTRLQQQERIYIAEQSVGWRALTQAQRDGWDTYAAAPAQDKTNPLGETYSASGFNWFVALNQHQRQAGKSLLTTAPVAARPTPPTITSGIIDTDPVDTATLTVPANIFDPDRLPVLFISKHRSQAVQNPGNLKFLDIMPYQAGATVDFTSAMHERYGNPEPDIRYFVTLAAQDPDDGQRSTAAVIAIDST